MTTYYEEHKERIKQSASKYYYSHKEIIKQKHKLYFQQYYLKNIERIREKCRNYGQERFTPKPKKPKTTKKLSQRRTLKKKAEHKTCCNFVETIELTFD